jgi:hypothetical protein
MPRIAERIVPTAIKKPAFLQVFRRRRGNSFIGGGCRSITLKAFSMSVKCQGFTEEKFVHGGIPV